MITQAQLDTAVRIATRCAMSGHPVSRIIYIPPPTATSQETFAVEYATPISGAQCPIWEQS